MITQLETSSKRLYELHEGMQLGSPVYIDRNYTITGFPGVLAGASILLTANDDKFSRVDNVVSFTLEQPSTVYVAHDKRIGKRPGWLFDWSDTGTLLNVSNHTDPFWLFSKSFPAGPVVLGGNEQTKDGSMYIVAIQPDVAVPDFEKPMVIVENSPGKLVLEHEYDPSHPTIIRHTIEMVRKA